MPETLKQLSLGFNYKLKPFVPSIVQLPAQRMVEVEVLGDPSTVSARVLPMLYATAYGIRKRYKDAGVVFAVEKLRGRWADGNLKRSKDAWEGRYGLPVPNDTESLPEIKKEKQVAGVNICLATWQYGFVGQILHEGPYSHEASTIERLHQHVLGQGYVAIPDSHEEVYLTDPNKTAPEKMKTILLVRLGKPAA